MADGTYVLFVARPTGYELTERQGAPPEPGEEIDLGAEGGGRYVVSKVAASPLPGDGRRCAYLQHV